VSRSPDHDIDGADHRHQQEIIQEVDQDGCGKSIVERHPEEEHPDKPAIDDPHESLVLITVTEERVGIQHRRTHVPASLTEDVLREIAKRCPVDQRPPHIHVEPLRDTKTEKAEEQEIPELNRSNSQKEDQPTKGDFLSDTSPGAHKSTPDKDLARSRTPRNPDSITDHRQIDDCDDRPPDENRQPNVKPGQDTPLRNPEIPEPKRNGLRPDPHDKRNHNERDDRTHDVILSAALIVI